jgi:hypothetical protein
LRKIGRARHSNGRRTPGARHSNGRRPPGARHSNGRRTPGARHSNGRRASGARHSNGRRTPGARHSNGRRPLIAHYSMAGARHSSFEWEARARCPSFEADEVVHPNGLPFRGASVVVRGIALGPRGVGGGGRRQKPAIRIDRLPFLDFVFFRGFFRPEKVWFGKKSVYEPKRPSVKLRFGRP